MDHKLIRATVVTTAIGATVVLGAAGARGALAGATPTTVLVPCSASALASDISAATSSETLLLTPGCTYYLHSALPDITTDLTIEGYGATLERSYAPDTPDFTILTVGGTYGLTAKGDGQGRDLTVVDVNFRNGGGSDDYHGGAIYNDGGTVTVRGGIFTDNSSDEYGGAIYNSTGNLTVDRASFTANFSDGEYGGAIYNEDNMTVTDSNFRGNGAGYGGAIYNEDVATLTGDTFFGNDAYEGGALYDDYEATLRVDTVQENTAGYGAGIYFDGSTLTVDDSHVFNNGASSGGGGIYNDSDGGAVTLDQAWIFGNVPDNCEPAGTIAGCLG
jgi:predicted outer membrane repeat protein